MADRPWSVASTDSRPQVPFYRHLESITAKENHGRLQSGAGRLATHWAHMSVDFAHDLLVSGAFPR
jgi:hypothetical protein